MKFIFHFLIYLLFSCSIYAQDNAEISASYPGGEQALFDYLARTIRYPKDASQNGIQGKVVVSFVVTIDGSIDSVRIVRSLYPSIDSEALRVIRMMSKWKPCKINGQPVSVRYAIPLTFELDEDNYDTFKKIWENPFNSSEYSLNQLSNEKLKSVLKFYQNKKYKRALALTEKIIKDNKDLIDIYILKARILFDITKMKEVCVTLTKAKEVGDSKGYTRGIDKEGLLQLLGKYCLE